MHDNSEQLRESGERLSLLADKFNQGGLGADSFIKAVNAHCDDLESAGLPEQAFATSVVALINLFRQRFDPDKMPDLYINLLFRLVVFCAQAQQKFGYAGDTFALEHFSEMGKNLIPVLQLSFKDMRAEANVPDNIAQMIASLDEVEQNTTFQGETITRFSVFDILCDCAARLTAAGIIDGE